MRLNRLLERLASITGRPGHKSERVERILLVSGVAIFVVSAVVAWRSLPDPSLRIRPVWLLVAGVLGGSAIIVNAREFAFSAQLLGRPVKAPDALRVSVLSSAANVLPMPGSVVMRSRALRQDGHKLRSAVGATTGIGLAWVSTAAFAAAALVSASGDLQLGVFFAFGATFGLVVALFLLRWSAASLGVRRTLQLLVIELVSVAVSGMRLFAVAQAFDLRVSVPEAVTINLGGILSSVVGILPGGLGIRELASGVFGGLVGVPTAVGVLLAVMDRLVFLLVLAAFAGALLTSSSGGGRDRLFDKVSE